PCFRRGPSGPRGVRAPRRFGPDGGARRRARAAHRRSAAPNVLRSAPLVQRHTTRRRSRGVGGTAAGVERGVAQLGRCRGGAYRPVGALQCREWGTAPLLADGTAGDLGGSASGVGADPRARTHLKQRGTVPLPGSRGERAARGAVGAVSADGVQPAHGGAVTCVPEGFELLVPGLTRE